MVRNFSSFIIHNADGFRQKLVTWADKFTISAVLDSCGYRLPHHRYDLVAGIGALKTFSSPAIVDSYQSEHQDWLFGHYGFEAGRKVKKAVANSGFADCCFFVPEIVIVLVDDVLQIGSFDNNADKIFKEICNTKVPFKRNYLAQFKAGITRNEFLSKVVQLKQHIRRGDCYEINFCQEFLAVNPDVQATDLYLQLIKISPAPFAAFYKNDDQYALCASPERFVKKYGSQIIAQPIKGTAPRCLADAGRDAENRERLQKSEKERRENVIVVDLVRNDLSRICRPGSVIVEELFGIYGFPAVFQMVSTITGQLSEDKNFDDLLDTNFPMGSMTGAPKKKVLELIDQYEPVPRGLYSGTIGYINPERDFDFNVVIRSLLYNQATGYLGYFAGAGITDLSDPEEEYRECLLKAGVLEKLFKS